jgi:hypothetical protein
MKKLILALLLVLSLASIAFGQDVEAVEKLSCKSGEIYVAVGKVQFQDDIIEYTALGRVEDAQPAKPVLFFFKNIMSGSQWAVDYSGDKKERLTIQEALTRYPNACVKFDTEVGVAPRTAI